MAMREHADSVRCLENYIAGNFVSSTSKFDNISPVDVAVKATHHALTGNWGQMPLADRAALLLSGAASSLNQKTKSKLLGENAQTFFNFNLEYAEKTRNAS